MKAVIIDPSAPWRIAIQDINDPRPLPSEAVVRVKAISLNSGEVHFGTQREAGTLMGMDFAGVVEQAANDGSGPRVGARVVGLVTGGAWAELVKVPMNSLAELPESVSFEQAATLPVAGMTAYYAVLQGGSLLEKKALVTGVTGGVGHFAVQLAKLSGAHVVAPVRRVEQQQVALDAGADEAPIISGQALAGAEQFAPYDIAVDGIGGAVLGAAMTMLAEDGVAVAYGVAGGLETKFNTLEFFHQQGGARLYGLAMYYELVRMPGGIALSRLARLVESGKLKPLIGVVRPWSELIPTVQDYDDRKFSGKAVLTLP